MYNVIFATVSAPERSDNNETGLVPMPIAFGRYYSLIPRGGAGLACDDNGVALGPVTLIEAAADPAGRRVYRMRPPAEVAWTLRLAYGLAPEDIERTRRGLSRIVKLLNAGNGAEARIQAVQLALPEISREGMAKLTQAAELQKYNPNYEEEPRIPAGAEGGGEWTDGDDEGAPADHPKVHPAAAQISDVQAKKERFVDAHLADALKAADQLGVPVENILGLSALESQWGESRFAVQGNNYFGIHYPAPYATGYIQAKGGPAKVATFASYSDSFKSFVALSGSIVRGKADPEAFATALQNSGKFGVDTESGAKVPSYVSGVAATIRGLRPIVSRRKI